MGLTVIHLGKQDPGLVNGGGGLLGDVFVCCANTLVFLRDGAPGKLHLLFH